MQWAVDSYLLLRGGEVTPKRITFVEANIAYAQTLGQGGCEISSIFLMDQMHY